MKDVTVIRIDPTAHPPVQVLSEEDMTDEEKHEASIWDHQAAWIKERFSAQDANVANYGWFTEVLDDAFAVATKVYGRGVLVTYSREPGVFEDRWEDG